MIFKGFGVAEWAMTLEQERSELLTWIESALQGALLSILMTYIRENPDLRALRAFKQRVLHGDEMDLSTVSSYFSIIFNTNYLASTLRVAPLKNHVHISEVEVRLAVTGLERYQGEVAELLNGDNWWCNSRLIIDAAIRIQNEVGYDHDDVVPIQNLRVGGKESSESAWVIREDLALLILRRGNDSLSDIISIMRERGTADIAAITNVLDAKVSALASGEL